MKHILFSFLIFFSTPSFSIRSVGNGAGEAEMKLLSYAKMLPVWVNGCQQNPNLCFHDAISGAAILDVVKSYLMSGNISVINFVNVSELKQSCNEHGLFVGRELLYYRNKTPIVETELMEVLVGQILSCFDFEDIQPHLKIGADGYIHTNGQSGVLKLQDQDIVVGMTTSKESLHQKMMSVLKCSHYKVLQQTPRGYQVRCSTSQVNYEVQIRQEKSGLQLMKFGATE